MSVSEIHLESIFNEFYPNTVHMTPNEYRRVEINVIDYNNVKAPSTP